MQAKVTIFIFGLLQLVTSAEVCGTPGALHVSLDTKSVNSFCYAYVFFLCSFCSILLLSFVFVYIANVIFALYVC